MVDQAVTVSKQEMRRRATTFASNFRDSTSEQADRQTFWNEFFEIFGISRRQVAAFELVAQRASTGRIGWIDLLYPGSMGVEHKSAGEDLDAAMGQLLDYLPSLAQSEHPWLLVTCDFKRFVWRNLEDGTHGEFPLKELSSHLDLFWWIAGYGAKSEFENLEDANLKATELMADIHDDLIANGYQPHALREWLTRILFCLFADDTDVWDRAAFHAYLAAKTKVDGSDLGPSIAYLFQIMDTPEADRPRKLDEDVAQFTYINGDLFAETIPIPTCGPETRAALLKACLFDWSAISPAIFGSMFQEVMTKTERRQLGAHYTTEQNILRTIEPLFLDDLRQELDAATSKAKLNAYLDKLTRLTFFDPACGCGNFLVVAYREIRELETEALRRLQPKNKKGRLGQLSMDISIQFRVKVDQFYGIEVEEFPAKIARTALYLIDHLCNRTVSQEFGEHFARFPIPASPHIHTANALQLDWKSVLPPSSASFVLGNPPFRGKKIRDVGQQRDMDSVFGGQLRELDYVAAWFELAAKYIQGTSARVAFVATNSITQGEQVPMLWPRLASRGIQLGFAHRTFSWSSEAAGKAHVHCVIVGFCDGSWGPPLRIFDYPDITGSPVERTAAQINGYLADAPPVYPGPRRVPVGPVTAASFGSMPNDGGNFLLTNEEAAALKKSDPIAGKYLRKILSTKQMLRGETRWCLWLPDLTAPDRRASPELTRRIENVRVARDGSTRAATKALAARPHLFGEIRQPTTRYLCIPRHVAENRRLLPMAFQIPSVIASDSTVFVEGADLYLFGLLQSAAFDAWLRNIGGRIKSDLRFSIENVYNTFPFPASPPAAKVKPITAAAQRVLDARAGHRGTSLADLYDRLATPADVTKAHDALDRAVDSLLFPRRRNLTEADRLSSLLTQYQGLVGATGL